MSQERKRVMDQFRTVLSAAIHLKGKFDTKEPASVISPSFELFLRDVEYLRKLVPEEIMEAGHLSRHIAWINKRLNENSPEQCYSDICDICFNDIFFIQDGYLNSVKDIEEEISDEVGIISKQIQLLNESDCNPTTWIYTTERLVRKIFPSDNINLVKQRSIRPDLPFTHNEKKGFINLLKGLILEIELSRKNVLPLDKWTKIHPEIAKVSKSRFETDHYGDATEAAFKEVNDIIKKAYLKKTEKEEDGDSLMRRSFSPGNPVFLLADLSTESGRNIQQGYMEIFAGSMKGIRNPKAHANMDVHPEESWEMIMLASHLMRMWDKYNA